MALSTAVITFDIADMLGVDFDARRTKAWTTTNVDNDTVIDTGANKIRLGDGKATVTEDGTGSFAVWTPGSGANPASWQTYFHFDYAKAGGRERTVRTFGPYTLSGNADLADLEQEQAVPPTYLSEVTGALQIYVTDAEDARDASAGSAAQATNALSQTVSLSQYAVAGLALDSDGQPYFDPTLIGTVTPTLALGVDTDGAPYLIGA